jgi:hypothetical protein
MTTRRLSEGSAKLPGASAPGRDASRAKRPASVEPSRMLQQSLGNQGVLRRMEAGPRINDVNDPAEKEADRVVAAAMASPASDANSPAITASAAPRVQRKCSACEKEEDTTLQRKESSPTQPMSVPPIIGQVLNSPGQPLDAGTLSFMENRFGYDFGEVRVHTDGNAVASAQAINALAYTVGQDIVFAGGQYTPQTSSGRHL